MTEPVQCHGCGATHDVNDQFCPRCGAASSTAPTIPSGGAPEARSAPSDAVLRELQETLAPQIQVIKELGAGGMGTVYLGRDPALKRLVAIKVLHPDFAHDESARKRFEREAEAAAAVAHPNVVNIYQVGVLPQSQSSYFVMQFIEGKTLAEAFPPGKPVPAPQARRVIGEVATALAAAHAKGLVHRDIKPANIMIESESGRTVVLDFGIRAVLQSRQRPGEPKLTATGSSIGTPTYMSPEQASAADVTPAADVYSLGCVAFELLTGRPPFVEQSAWAVMAAHIKEKPPRVVDLAPGSDDLLAGLVDRSLKKTPSERPLAADVARALLPGRDVAVEWPPPGLDRLRGRGAELAARLGTAAAVGLLFFLILRAEPTPLLPEWHAEPFVAFDATLVWYLGIGSCLTSLLALVPLVGWRVWCVATLLRAGRRSGYPWAVLLDVAWDQRADTDAFLNGVGVYALLLEPERRRMMVLRRRQAGFAAASIVLAVVSPLLWLAGVTGGWAGNLGAVLPDPELNVLLLPALIGLAGLWWNGRPEAKLHARLGQARTPSWRDEPPVRQELVGAWLAAVGRAGRGRVRPVPRVVLVAGPMLLIVALVVGAAIMLAVMFLVSNALNSAREDARTIVQSMHTDSLRPMAWQQLDSMLGASARLTSEMLRPFGLDSLGASLEGTDWKRAGTAAGLLLPRIGLSVGVRRFRLPPGFRGKSELAREDPRAALVQARLAIATGRAMLHEVQTAARAGLMVWIGAQGLIRIGDSTGDPELAAEGVRLRSAMDRARLPRSAHWPAATGALMADATSAALLPFLRDSTLSPLTRAAAAQAIVYGFCLNAREVLFGVDSRRRARLAEAEAALSDVMGAGQFLRDLRGDLDTLIANPSAAGRRFLPGFPQRAPPIAPQLQPLGWIGLGGLRDRLAYCQEPVPW